MYTVGKNLRIMKMYSDVEMDWNLKFCGMENQWLSGHRLIFTSIASLGRGSRESREHHVYLGEFDI